MNSILTEIEKHNNKIPECFAIVAMRCSPSGIFTPGLCIALRRLRAPTWNAITRTKTPNHPNPAPSVFAFKTPNDKTIARQKTVEKITTNILRKEMGEREGEWLFDALCAREREKSGVRHYRDNEE